VPYLRCPTCDVLSYVPRSYQGVTCPECGVPVTRNDAKASESADARWRLDQLLRMTRDLVDTDVALLTEIREGHEIARQVAGKWPGRASLQDVSLPLEHTFCQRMLDGRIGNYICDASKDDRVSDLAMARHLGIRAWLGVPIELSDMRLYVLCCLASESRPGIGEREVRLLAGLAESVRAELQERDFVIGPAPRPGRQKAPEA
jgi:GAF domain-containing protein